MVYTFGLVKQVNTRYRDALIRLNRCELISMLRSISIDCDIKTETFGGAFFLTFESRPLKPAEISFLARHSSVAFLAEKTDGMLRPLSFDGTDYLEEDLPEILKYKGKTSVSLTRMMLNTALSVSDFHPLPASSLTLLDPVCGKGTACFCALQGGMNAIGLDCDRKSIKEASDYFSRYLRFHMLKHSVRHSSETSGKRSIPVTEYVFADSKVHFQRGETRFLKLGTGDTSDVYALCRRTPVHLLIADLPYGIQHAPQYGTKTEPFEMLLRRAMTGWKKALLPGAVISLSFNTLTLPKLHVLEIAENAGLYPVTDTLFSDLCHEVDQAVVRDVVFLKYIA